MPLAIDITEKALRAAANNPEASDAAPEKKAALMKTAAVSSAKAHTALNPEQLDLQAIAIETAIVGIGLTYQVIASQIATFTSARLDFEQSRQACVGTFIIPTNKEESALSNEEATIKRFMDLIRETEIAEKNTAFSKYLGVGSADLTERENAKFCYAPSFFRMSKDLDSSFVEDTPLERERNAIALFLKAAIPDAIETIEEGFKDDLRVFAFMESVYQRNNYLNNRRAPRFVIIALSNLLWNLQHPINPTTGFPLSLAECIKLCDIAQTFLIQLLNPDSPAYLSKISNSENNLLSMVWQIELYIRTLKAAYIKEQLSELKIGDIKTSAHNVLRIMDQGILKLIYKRKGLPDEKAAEAIADKIGFLNLLLKRNSALLSVLHADTTKEPAIPSLIPAWVFSDIPGINNPPRTIIDIIVIFCQLPKHDRESVLKKIETLGTEDAKQFVEALSEFYSQFIQPIRKISKKELGSTSIAPIGRLTASRLIPVIMLVIDDFRVDVDTPAAVAMAQEHGRLPRVLSGKQQVQAISLDAQSGKGFYTWSISPLVERSATMLDQLPKHQYRLAQMVKLIEGIADLVQHYRTFLQYKAFQTFLLKCLAKIKEEYTALDRQIASIDKSLSENERISRHLQAILYPFVTDLDESLKSFDIATQNFQRIVGAPDFIDQQRQRLSAKLSVIDEQYKTLFQEDSGIDLFKESLLPPEPSMVPLSPSPVRPKRVSTDIADTKMVLELRKLIQHCFDALSNRSKHDRKGLLLRDLLSIVDGQPNFTPQQIRRIVLELARVTACYRPSVFFQASYGQTRSAKAFIAAIKDPKINSVLPLADIIFEHQLKGAPVDDNQIIRRLKSLRAVNQWQISSTKKMWIKRREIEEEGVTPSLV
jgi:hypothetical protein